MWKSTAAGPPDQWQAIVVLMLVPIAWIPGVQGRVMQFLFAPPGWSVALKVALLLLPALLLLWALWCTSVAFYTILFRAQRRLFMAALLMAWWDAARAVWSYWVGLVRFVYIAAGWVLTLGRLGMRLIAEGVRRVFVVPVVAAFQFVGRYARPGLPWLAMVLLVGWAALEASAFTYLLYPDVWNVMEAVVGVRAPAATGPVLYIVLALVVLGSFACLDALREVIEQRRVGAIVVRGAVLVVVAGFEVGLMYREVVEAVAPRIAERAGAPLGSSAVLAVAAFVWVAVRGATWFLFGRFGTRPLAALMSRRPMAPDVASARPDDDRAGSWSVGAIGGAAPRVGRDHALPNSRGHSVATGDIRAEIVWLRSKARDEIESLTLPVVQLLAAALNLAVVVLTARPVFALPLVSLAEATAGRDLLLRLRLHARRHDDPAESRGDDAPETGAWPEANGTTAVVTADDFARLGR